MTAFNKYNHLVVEAGNTRLSTVKKPKCFVSGETNFSEYNSGIQQKHGRFHFGAAYRIQSRVGHRRRHRHHEAAVRYLGRHGEYCESHGLHRRSGQDPGIAVVTLIVQVFR